MLLHDIKELIEALSDYPNRKAFDHALILKLEERFNPKLQEELLSEDDLDYIKSIFEDRWLEIIDTDLDYTANTDGINNIWISLAKKLADNHSDLSYISLLFPYISNIRDPHNFSRIEDNTDCLELYVGEDNDSLHLVLAFIKHLDHLKLQLSTYRNKGLDSSQLHPVSVNELSRFRRSTGKSFLFYETRYNNLWDFLKQKIFVNLQRHGEMPVYLFPLFQDLIKLYFDKKEQRGTYTDFRQELTDWLDCLYECPVNDINKFYGIELQFNGQSVYLLELLIDIFEARDYSIDSQFKAITQWFVEYNPAYVVEHHELHSIYRNVGCGPFFSINNFKELLEQLLDQEGLSDEIIQNIVLLVSLAETSSDISAEMINQLKAIYSSRWERIAGSNLDYTRLQTGINAPWIHLVQYLVGAGKINSNYYNFLMPTLQADKEPAFDEAITNYPLSHFILSENASNLILLDVCVKQHQSNGTFCYWDNSQWTPLTTSEVARIQYANPSFQSYYHRASSKVIVPPVSLNTIVRLKELIENSIYSKGLYYGKYYDDREMSSTATALVEFARAIPDDERKVLNQQLITQRGVKKTFAEVWQGIEADECITLLGKYLLQLLMDYAPYIKFSDEFEDQFEIMEMRECSRNLIFSDYDYLTQAEAEENCQFLFLSLMTYSFQMLPLCGKHVEFWDFKNSVNDEARKIFNLLSPMIQSGDFKKARFVYAQICEGIIKPGIVNNSIIHRLKSLNKTQQWLIDLNDGKLLGQKFRLYEATQLLQFALSVEDRKAPYFEKLITELMRTCVQDNSELNLKLRANIVFVKFISSLDTESIHSLQEKMAAFDFSFSSEDVYKHCKEYLSKKLNLVSRKSRNSFFVCEGKVEMDAISAENSNENTLNSVKDVLDGISKTLMSSSQEARIIAPKAEFLSRILEPVPKSDLVNGDDIMDFLNSNSL